MEGFYDFPFCSNIKMYQFRDLKYKSLFKYTEYPLDSFMLVLSATGGVGPNVQKTRLGGRN